MTGPRVIPARTMTERDLTRFVADTARTFGWHRYHTHRSDFSPAGWPDEALCRVDRHTGTGRLVLAELKSATGKLSDAQRTWLDLLGQVPGLEVYLWRPADIDEIVAVLGPTYPPTGTGSS